MEKKDVILTVNGMDKSFGATKALKNVGIEIYRNEIHGLIGENGSGKSTLSSIIAGMQKCDEGTMEYCGRPYGPANIFEAEKAGIAMVGQEQNTLEDISVAENIFIGKEERFQSGPIVNSGKMNREARTVLDGLGLGKIKAEEQLKHYDFEQRKLVEIARALYDRPELMIVDETSTALSKYGREILYRTINGLRDQNKAVLFISHDIVEIMAVCDRVTILRDGEIVCTLPKEQYDSHTMKQYMVGREIEENYYRTDYENRLTDEVALRAEHINTEVLKDVSLELHYGEILGIGGLTDCGMHELGQVLCGLRRPVAGSVCTGDGTPLKNPSVALKKKIAYISKNRDKEALMLSSTILENICLPSLDKVKKGLLVTPGAEKAFALKYADLLSVKMDRITQNVMYLSGGNKQKVAVAKWLGTDADIYIFDCPTRGIDVGVQSDIYDLLERLRKKKKAILMISEELPEVIGMSDRILILKDGSLTAEIGRSKNTTENTLIHYII